FEAADEHRAKLGIVLDDHDTWACHSSLSIAPRGRSASLRSARAEASAAPTRAAAARPPRKSHGAARWSGGGSNTWRSIATSISASSQPSSAASASAAPSTSAASLQRNAPIWRTEAPSAAMVASSERVARGQRELLDGPDDVERRDPEVAGRAVEHAQLEQVADPQRVVGDRLLGDEDPVRGRAQSGEDAVLRVAEEVRVAKARA